MDDVLAAINAGRRELSRYRELPELDRIDALVRATELFAGVYPVAPEAVPESLRPVCEAIWTGREQMAYTEPHNQAIDLLDEARRTRDRATVDQAIWFLVMAALGAADDPLLPGYLSHLGTAWDNRFRLTARVADLDNSIAVHRRALALPIADVSDQAGFLANLANALRARYEAAGDVSDLDQAVAAARQAADAARPAWARRPDDRLRFGLATSLENLVAALSSRFQLSRDRSDLDEAVDAGREGTTVVGLKDPGRPTMLGLLANALLERFERYGEAPDLTEALQAAQDGVKAAEPGSTVRAVCLSCLALARDHLFRHTGDIRDSDRAIETGRESVAAARGDRPGTAICLSNLGGILRTRYERTGDAGVLDEAVEVQREAVENTPAASVHLPGFLSNLGNTLRNRFELGGPDADIREAIDILERAVATAHRGLMDRPGYVANLAITLLAAAEHRVDPAALRHAITILEQELGALAATHSLRHLCLASSGYAWRARFERTGDANALDKAIGYLDQAVRAVSATHPQRAEYLTALGAACHMKLERSPGDLAAGAAALRYSAEAASTATAPALTRALAARNWAQAAARLGDTHEAACGFAQAVDLIDRVAWRGLRRSDQERHLGQFAALACDAAAWAIQAGDPERAVELLEQGRGVLLAQALDDRSREHDLNRASPNLARQLTDVDRLLDRLPSAADLVPADGAGLTAERADLSRRREMILEQIRALPGFSDFLRPPAFEVLREAGRPGPVVIVNVSGYRSDALILTGGGVQVIPLPALTGQEVARQATGFLGMLHALHLGLTYATEDTALGLITEILAWLWDALAEPLLPALQDACAPRPGERPRIWWCPTGPLTFLPLHAAGRHRGDGDSVLDHFVSSYALTVRMLLRTRGARDRASVPEDDAGGPGPMVVAMPVTPGQRPLPKAGVEADVFVQRFPGACQFRGTAATPADVKRALEQSPTVAHFACHGTQDVTDPSSGHLALHNGDLGITEVASMRLDSAELAFLSACETARGSIQLSDEAITIAAAFQLAGYRHVIGTLWSISDDLAPEIARHVYDRLPGAGHMDTAGTAAALDAAIRSVRGLPGIGPVLWAPYLHLGP